MSRTIELPEQLYLMVKAHADEAGLSLPDYIRGLLGEEEAPTPVTREEIFERLQRLTPVTGDFDAAEIVREAREEREEELWQAIRGDVENDRR